MCSSAHTRSKEKKAAQEAKSNKQDTRGNSNASSSAVGAAATLAASSSAAATAPITPVVTPDKRNKWSNKRTQRPSSFGTPITAPSITPIVNPAPVTTPAYYAPPADPSKPADGQPVAALPTPDPTPEITPHTTPLPQQPQEVSAEEFLPDSQSLPSYATSSATKVLQRQLKQIIKTQLSTTSGNERYWTLDLSRLDDLYTWYFSLTTFDPDIPLSGDMRRFGVSSIQLQVKFYPPQSEVD
jgi:hypothetical protein